MQTVEGVAAVDEAVRALRAAAPAPLLATSPGLCLAARDLAVDQARSGLIGHDGSDGSTMQSRIESHGKWFGTIAENISYGYGDGSDVVMRLVVDDGVPSRGHRHNTLNPALRVVGVACGGHPEWGQVCVVDLAGAYVENRARTVPRGGGS
jgi:uncharacterized protein YkwD